MSGDLVICGHGVAIKASQRGPCGDGAILNLDGGAGNSIA